MKSVASNFKFKHEFAKIISNIVQPVIVTIPVFIIINYFAAGPNNFLISTLICLLFGTFLPLTAALMWIKSKNLDLDVSNKDERTFPLLFGAISYIIGIIMLFTVGAPTVAAILMLCYLSNIILTIFVTFFWKISVHSMGIAGPAAAIICIFGYPGLLFGFPLIMVMWSRVYLNQHTPAQVIVGA
ncbi:MAG TPA: PAP2 family protein, partial [Methanobacterium sp.]|nr:PAP2 family protein [Methanobacterium sp.]